MKIFDFEQKILIENGNNVNLIYKRNGKFSITTINNRANYNEVERDQRIVYSSLEDLFTKSKQLSKYSSFNTFLIDASKSTDAAKWEVEQLITIKKIKSDLKLTDEDIANLFSYKNKLAYSNSSAKKRIEAGLVSFYLLIKKSEGKNLK